MHSAIIGMDCNGNSKKKPQRYSKKLQKKMDKNDSGHGDSSGTSTTFLTPVETMTSRDFHIDYNAHIEMMFQVLKDTVRINTFKAAILHNKHLFKGKCILNVGCGTGIYAMFAAEAGAEKVFAVDTSNVVYYTKKIVQTNGYSEIIKVMKGEIEEIELPVEKVDIILCDWMGYALLYQSLCDTVIYARDKWLKNPGGLIFPDQGKLYMVALEDTKHKNGNINWWSNVYGFNMRCFRDVALDEPRCQSIRTEQVISKQFPIKTINLNTATLDDLTFRSKFILPIQKSGPMDGIALYFHICFTKSHTPLGFSTDPWSPRTNWLQTILFFDQSLSVNSGSIYYGGIEFTSLEKPVNLNNIVVNLELLLGDPKQADVEMEMSWHFKLSTACTISEGNKNKSIKLKTIEKNAKQIFNEADSKLYQENRRIARNYKSNQNNSPVQMEARRSGLVLTYKDNNTIKIGKYNCPRHTNSRNKWPSPKK